MAHLIIADSGMALEHLAASNTVVSKLLAQLQSDLLEEVIRENKAFQASESVSLSPIARMLPRFEALLAQASQQSWPKNPQQATQIPKFRQTDPESRPSGRIVRESEGDPAAPTARTSTMPGTDMHRNQEAQRLDPVPQDEHSSAIPVTQEEGSPSLETPSSCSTPTIAEDESKDHEKPSSRRPSKDIPSVPEPQLQRLQSHQ